jgi:hypothetical protein
MKTALFVIIFLILIYAQTTTVQAISARDELKIIAQKIQKEREEAKIRASFQSRVERATKAYGLPNTNRTHTVVGSILTHFGVDAPLAFKIGFCESGLNPESINWDDAKITGYPSWGLFQLNRPKFEGWNDPETNVKEAKKLFDRRGWQPWSCSKKV